MARAIATSALAELLGEDWQRPGAAASGLADALRALVVDGRLPVRTRLPGERALAPELGVGRGTVSRAYDRLREDGFLVSDRGAGSRLALPGGTGGPAPAPPLPDAGAPDGPIDLTIAALPAPEPWLGEAAVRAARLLARHGAGHGYTATGLPELREALAQRFADRGLPTTPDEILVTAGAQHALHLVLRLYGAPGDRVLVDAPLYPRSLSAVRATRLRPVAVPLTARGWDVDGWGATIAAAAPRLALTIPDFHNPTGLTMGADARVALTAACARAGVVLVADETTAELRLDGPPVPAPLAAHGPVGTVVTLGSMSKSAWGGLRLGWVRAPAQVVRELAAVRADLDMASPLLEQLVAVELLADWEAVVSSRRALLRERRGALLDALAREAPDWEVRRPAGGLSTWVRLPAPVATPLAALAAREVRITPGPAFSVDGAFEHHLRLPFSAPPATLRAAVALLAPLAVRLDGRATAPLEPAAPVLQAI